MHPTFCELTEESEWREAHPVLQTLRPDLDLNAFLARRVELISQGYRLFGIRNQERIVSVAGVVTSPHITRGTELWIHDLATIREVQSRGFGTLLMQEIEKIAKHFGYSRVLVHSRIDNPNAHRFYETRAEFDKYAYVFTKVMRASAI
jgi:GNAT superfamily N-acetyltransferase